MRAQNRKALQTRIVGLTDALSAAVEDMQRYRSDALAWRFKAGDSIETLASAYALPRRDVEGILRARLKCEDAA